MNGMSVLDCCAGPSAFAKQASERGIMVTACDPRYADDLATLTAQVQTDAEDVQLKQAALPQFFYPEVVSVPERKQAMEEFLQDYEQGKIAGRYVPGRLPALPFDDIAFDMVLSANLLFMYSEVSVGGMMPSSPLDYRFHLNSIKELMRVTRQDVRIYPLQAPGHRRPHRWLEPLIAELATEGLHAETVPVTQRDIIGAEKMLQIRKIVG